MNLSGMNLSRIDLSEADLTGSDLSGAKLFKANLQGAMLMRTNLETAEMTGADLSGANLEDAQCKRAGLGMASLKGAHLFRCNLEETTLSLTDFTGADLRNSNLRRARIREANIVNADLTNADLRETDLSLSTVKGSTFTNADLREARLRLISGFEKATWIGVDIRDVNFAGAYRMRRNIIDQNFIKEFRAAGKLSAAMYYLWWITSDCGRSMLRWCMWIMILSLFYAWLFTFVEIDYGEYRTWLSPFYYSVVTLTTLGYGDIMPASVGGQFIAMMEVMSGYMMLGGLLSIFSNKIARRAD
ncbi:MAG: pentapeptide repeat-containing protein [Candidatus Latescibacteria bacterium]|nr:pentapeptide repeat-containing protein [Candidatus Latescibacterota bacterium]